jgi:hypothetical protein
VEVCATLHPPNYKPAIPFRVHIRTLSNSAGISIEYWRAGAIQPSRCNGPIFPFFALYGDATHTVMFYVTLNT